MSLNILEVVVLHFSTGAMVFNDLFAGLQFWVTFLISVMSLILSGISLVKFLAYISAITSSTAGNNASQSLIHSSLFVTFTYLANSSIKASKNGSNFSHSFGKC